MKKLLLPLSGILLITLISGCTSVKRFKSATYESVDNSLVDMEIFGSRLIVEEPDSDNRNLWDLSASAQPQMIQILNERYPDNARFMEVLNAEYLTGRHGIDGDFTKTSLRMIFTISKKRDYSVINEASGRFSPADRIEYLKFSLEIPEEYNLHFNRWNRYSTEYGEIEIADVSFTKSLELDLDGSFSAQSDAKGKGSLSLNEKQNVRSRYLKLNGSLNNRKIVVEEEGTREIDLTGNVIADVNLGFKGFPERLTIPVFAGREGGPEESEVALGDEGRDAGSDAGGGELIILSFADVLVPRLVDAPDTIKARLHLHYIYRHVQSGWKTYPEWDDRVEFYSGDVDKDVVLFTKRDYLPDFYTIGTTNTAGNTLKVQSINGTEYPLQFRDRQDATRFLGWLESLENSEEAVTIGKSTILFQGKVLKNGQINKLDLKAMPVY